MSEPRGRGEDCVLGGHSDAPARPSARQLMSELAPKPGAAKPDAILVVDNIARHFGGITAVDVDHLEVQRGIITALIGPNGAGKTTFFNLITGFDRPSSVGQGAHWSFDGATSTGPRRPRSPSPAWSAPSSSPRR